MTKSKTPREAPIRFKVRPIQKSSISDEIVQQLIALISSGEVKAGERLPSERELCRKFAAGRSSVREALRCLSIMGILKAKVGEGTSVAMDGNKFLGTVLEWRIVTERHDIENLMEVRVALEGAAAAGAARRGNETSLKHLQKVLKKMEVTVGDTRRFAEHDLNFHLELAKASENDLILGLVSMIRGQLERTISKILILPDEMPLSLKEHRAIFQAVKKGDPEAARAAVQAHLNATVGRYRKAARS